MISEMNRIYNLDTGEKIEVLFHRGLLVSMMVFEKVGDIFPNSKVKDGYEGLYRMMTINQFKRFVSMSNLLSYKPNNTITIDF